MLLDLTPRTGETAEPQQPLVQPGPDTSMAVTTPAATIELSVTQVPSQARGYLSRPYTEWDWQDLRDYVVHEVEVRRGLFPRSGKKEYGIFSRFLSTYGDLSGLIAKYAFEVCDGTWRGAPISVNRFCKASDEFFAIPILEAIADSGWLPES